MGKKNVLLLGVAIVAIGLFVIPSTMSMFVGQHQWYSVKTPAQQYQLCERCHQAEVGEWTANSGAHSVYRDLYENSGCFCHQINESQIAGFGINTSTINAYGFEVFNGSGILDNDAATWNSSAWRTADTPHAAITIGCTDCHFNATLQLANNDSAHKQFQEQATSSSGATANTACMACHTMVGLDITMERNYGGLIISANHTVDAGSYNWTVDVSINSSRTNTSTVFAPNGS